MLSPEATKMGNTTVTQAIADGLCYHYLYDKRGRMVEKTLPGKETEYFIYDNRDRMVLSQDGNQRVSHQWLATVYDCLDRPIATAVYSSTYSRSGLSIAVNDLSVTNAADELFFYLKNFSTILNTATDITDANLISLQYYDDYNYGNLSGMGFTNSLDVYLPSSPVYGVSNISVMSINTAGKLTGTSVKLLGPDGNWGAGWLNTINYYDDKGRLIQQQKNNIAGGTDILASQYDFADHIVMTVQVHSNIHANNSSLLSINVYKAYSYNYDNGHLMSVRQKINNGPWMGLQYLLYDDLGRVSSKVLADGPATGFHEDYTYNVRGWLNSINADYVDGTVQPGIFGPYFGEKITYDKGFESRLYNGNIAGIEWKGGSAGARKQFYGYAYDPLNRLNHAEYGIWDPLTSTYIQNNVNEINYTASGITYDDNGNLQAMAQKGPLNDPASSGIIYDNMDVLDYSYKPFSNQLDHVHDALNVTDPKNRPSTPDFRDNNTGTGDYDYDVNGNTILDRNKGINNPITYSLFNKPLTIDINGNTIEFTYDAMGQQLRKTITPSGGIPEYWSYMDGFVWKNDDLQYIQNEEGRARLRTSTGTDFDYDYFIKDHLSNVRTVVGTQAIRYTPPNDDNSDVDPAGRAMRMAPGVAPAAEEPHTYEATMEIASANVEGLLWDNLDDVRDTKPGSTNPQDLQAARLNASDSNRSIGTALMLRVMTGDQFTLDASTFYDVDCDTGSRLTGEELANALLMTLSGGTINSTTPVSEVPENLDIIKRAYSGEEFANVINSLQNQNIDPLKPKSFLNYVVFDENMKVMVDQSGVLQTTGNGQWTAVSMSGGLSIKQPGYLTVFTSSKASTNTFWDQIKLVQYKGAVLEENHYYPFGLTLSINSAVAAEKNSYKLTTKELQDEFGLNWYNFGARGYDMQTGRWLQHDLLSEKIPSITPYNYVQNNPVRRTDPSGMGDGEFESEYDKSGNKVSDLGGDKVDFHHQEDGSTKIVDRETGASNSINGGEDLINGYTPRDKSTSWSKITNEFAMQFGPANSIFADFDNSKQGAFGSLHSAFSSYSQPAREMSLGSNKSKDVFRMDYGNANPIVAKDLWEQMWGRSNVSWYKLGDKTLFMMNDSKSATSLFYRATSSWERTQGGTMGNTRQTYIWLETNKDVQNKADQYKNYWHQQYEKILQESQRPLPGKI